MGIIKSFKPKWAHHPTLIFKLGLLTLVTLPFDSVEGANILFLFGGVNVSHKLAVWPFVRGLAENGHNVTFISSNPEKLQAPSSGQVLDITPASYIEFTKDAYQIDRIQNRKENLRWDLSDINYDEVTLRFCEVSMANYREDKNYRDTLTSVTYDLVVVNTILNECALYLIHQFGAKFIVLSSMTVVPSFYGTYGLHTEVSTIPEMMFANVMAYPPGLLDRMWNFYRYSIGYDRRDLLKSQIQKVASETLQLNNPPGLIELERQASLVFLNTHYSTDFARALPPSFVGIGGMQCWDKIEQLPENIKKYIDGATDGVVLITFGSTVDISGLDKFYIDIFFNSMRKLSKFRFIWRWQGSLPDGAPPNLFSANWLPQRAILNHPKTKAFMTHGGLNSINEATFHGVPLIVLPLFADQDYNSYRIKAKELGVVVEVQVFSQELLDQAFSEVLLKPKYKRNMEVHSKIFKDRPMNPVKTAIWWTEFVLRHDNTSPLKPMLVSQSWWVRNSIDVCLAFFLLFAIPSLTCLYITVKFLRIMT